MSERRTVFAHPESIRPSIFRRIHFLRIPLVCFASQKLEGGPISAFRKASLGLIVGKSLVFSLEVSGISGLFERNSLILKGLSDSGFGFR